MGTMRDGVAGLAVHCALYSYSTLYFGVGLCTDVLNRATLVQGMTPRMFTRAIPE